MATYYVSTAGNDSNNGLGPDASHATNKPWLTLGKLWGAAGFSSGDLAYVGPGVHRGVSTFAMTSPVAETIVRGDPLNTQGFKDGSGVLLSPAYCRITAYTTNDTTAPSASSLITLAGRDYITFENLMFQGGSNAVVIDATTATSINLKFKRCVWLPSGGSNTQPLSYVGLVDAASNLTIERCVIFGHGTNVGIRITLPTSASADYDSAILLQNLLLINGGAQGIFITASGANSFKGGGVDIKNSTIMGGNALVATGSANVSTSIPCTIENSLLFSLSVQAALNANTSGQITENYCLIHAGTPRTNVSAGANSISNYSYAPLIELLGGFLWDMDIFPFGMPMASSPLLAFGGTGPSDDLFGETRPGTIAVGAMERNALVSTGGTTFAMVLEG